MRRSGGCQSSFYSFIFFNPAGGRISANVFCKRTREKKILGTNSQCLPVIGSRKSMQIKINGCVQSLESTQS